MPVPNLDGGVLEGNKEAELAAGLGELLPDVLDGEGGRADRLAHAVPRQAGVGAEGAAPRQLVHVPWLQLGTVFEPSVTEHASGGQIMNLITSVKEWGIPQLCTQS